jgi:3'-5' exoribonuclease
LADRYLEDGPLMDNFCMAPAATSLHHAFLGGLLEHTLGLMEMAEKILPFYPGVNRDIVLMGLFLHDVGKCRELSWENGFAYTTDGQLVGHIARGAILLAEKAKACEDKDLGEAAAKVPEKILLALTHIVLSHHEKPEFGAAKIPATPEAILVAHLDNMDAKMNMVLAAADRGNPKAGVTGEFTEKVWALETRIWRADPTQ